MENILQSLVKIIIIGALYEKSYVNCNRQFLPPLPPPLPYYQNEDFYLPGFAPALRDQVPAYYPQRHLPRPTSFQNIKTYTPPRLFYQNDNFIPPPVATPALRYPLSHPLSHNQASLQPHKPQQKLTLAFSRVQYKNPSHPQPNHPQQVSQKKTEAFASNIIVKEEPLTPYYPDEYSKNYNDEDYIDSYSDDTPTLSKPCTPNELYRYFEEPKETQSTDNKYTLCNPYFQPNFGSSVYTLKVPITLLPSRFPPRVEQLIERIQNYFSTYTQQQNLRPQNETSPASSTPAAAETSTESPPQSTTAAEVYENQQETSSTSGHDSVSTTEKVVSAEIKDSHASAATPPDSELKNSPLTEAPTTLRVDEVTETVTDEVTEQVAGTAAEANQPVSAVTFSGEVAPHSPHPDQPVHASSSTTAESLKRGSEHNSVTQTNGSPQPTDSNNG